MRKLSGFWSGAVLTLSIALVVFQMYTACFGVFSDVLQRSVHLFFVLTLCFILKPAGKKAPKDKVPVYDIIIVIISAASTVYMMLHYKEVLWNPSTWLSGLDKFFAIALVIICLEASRRCVGLTFPVMGILFFIYAYFGPSFPGIWGHAKFDIDYIFQNFYHSTNGIWGTMVGISATMLAMFGIFGSVLAATGGSQTFIKVGEKLTGKSIGGPGKVALISSGLFGMISGSAMGNVVATGTFTIPMMKEAGYDKEWSAAVSAVGSTGGQIMPPIMGAGAFVMAQLIGVAYLDIAIAAVVPAILYYLGALVAVHYMAAKLGIVGKKVDEKISWQEYTIIGCPLIVFVVFLVMNYAVTTAAFYGTVVGIVTVFAVSLITNKEIKRPCIDTARMSKEISLKSAASILDMAALLAGAQIAISLISLTGFGVKLSNIIIQIGQGNLFLCLLLSMMVCIILGMGLPTTAAYVLAASVLAPALIKLGLPILVAHLFVFYFSCLATITPPVCAAVFLAAGIAEAKWVKTGFLSVLLALPAFIVPFTFAYDQSLLLIGSAADVVVGVITALVGVYLMGMAIAGYIKRPLNMLERAALIAAGVLMTIPNYTSSAAGLALALIIILVNVKGAKKEARA